VHCINFARQKEWLQGVFEAQEPGYRETVRFIREKHAVDHHRYRVVVAVA
jgi:hypothetical protein